MTLRAASPANPSGFTLVEMLVALTIFALLAAAGVGLLRASVDTQAAVEGRLGELKGIERLHALFAADLGQAVDRPVRDGAAARPALVGSAGELRLVRAGWTNLDESPRSTLQRVTWRLSGGRLGRTGHRALDGGNAGEEAILAERLVSARFRYRSIDGGWVETWPSAGGPSLPRAVELTLERQGEEALVVIAALPPPPPPPRPATPPPAGTR